MASSPTETNKSQTHEADSSSEGLRGMVDAISRSQAVIEFKLDGTIITANENFCNAVGYSLQEIQGNHHRMFVDAEFASSAEYTGFWAKLNHGEFVAGDFKRVGKGGKEIWIQASYNPIFNADGKPVKIVKFATDITEQKIQDADYEGKVSAISRSQAVIEFKLDGTIITANENFCNAVGYSLQEIQGNHHRMFVDAEYGNSPEYSGFWAQLNRGEYVAGEFKRVGKGGKEIWIQASYNPIVNADGKPVKVVKFATDITQQKLASQKAGSLASMLDGAGAMFMACDEDLHITYCNPAVEKMLRRYQDDIRKFLPSFNADTLIGTNIDVFHKNPSHQRSLLGDVSRLPVSSELKLGPLTFGVRASALFDADGNYTGNGVEWTDFNAREAYRREVDKVIQATSSGDLTVRGDLESLDDTYRPMMQGINEIIDAFEQALTNVSMPVEEVSSASLQISEGAQKLAEGANTQASSLEEISASLEEIASMTSQNADNANEAKTLANTAQSSAQRGNETMQTMKSAIDSIKSSSDETAKIVRTIDEIAFQTNLLALNAAVEAARAGDAGKGFAVVAEEVRSLAQRSAEAAKNTASLIEMAVNNADSGVATSEEVSGILTEIFEGSTKVNDLINEIAAASKEQSDGISQVNDAVDQINKVTQDNAASSEESAAAAGELNTQVGQLQDLVGAFTLTNQVSRSPSRTSTPSGATPRTSAPSRQLVGAGTGTGNATPRQVIPLDDSELTDF